jgi:phosphate uptake regulator
MKNFYKLTAVALLLLPLSMTSFAADTTPPAEPQKAAEPMKHGGMMGNMTEEQQEQHLKAMQEHILKMHDLSNQILAEKDPAKQEQLKKQQRDLMKAHQDAMMKAHHKM